MSSSIRHFYVSIFKRDNRVTGFGSSSDPSRLTTPHTPAADSTTPTVVSSDESALTFEKVFTSYVSITETYRKFIPTMLGLAPFFTSFFTEQRIAKFARQHGVRHNLSNDSSEIFELDTAHYRQFRIHADDVASAFAGGRHLPEVMIIGLISSYDAFLARLLEVIINRHPEIVLTADKNIKLSELTAFGSIDEVRASLIAHEVESVIRLSHHEQFDWMEKRFSTPLREQLHVWPAFIELCERRNLFTHTGGIVSKQYVDNCRAHKCDTGTVKIGEKVSVNPEYFTNAVKAVYEIGAKLCHVLWRKFAPDERETADDRLSELGYDLIYMRAYDIAEPLLRFGTDVLKKHANDRVRRMMVVNLANTLRLQGRKEEMAKLLDKEDWSACSDDFKVCVAAVKEQVDLVVQLMQKIGADGSPRKQDYRTWPIFRGIRTDERFMNAFENVFGETVIVSDVADIEVQQEDGQEADPKGPTKH